MIPVLSMLVVLAVPAAPPAPETVLPAPAASSVTQAVEAELPALATLEEALGVTNNCFIRCDNGISVDGWVSSCQECAQIAYANCNQQGTYGGYFYGPGCSDWW